MPHGPPSTAIGDGSVHNPWPAVAELRGAGLTVRDVVQLLGVTPSRVSRIEKQASLRTLPNGERPGCGRLVPAMHGAMVEKA